MARHNTALDKRVEEYLDSKGISPDMVRTDYVIRREGGMTLIDITLYAEDFMDEPPNTDPDLFTRRPKYGYPTEDED